MEVTIFITMILLTLFRLVLPFVILIALGTWLKTETNHNSSQVNE